MFNVDGKLSKCLNKCLMLIDGGAGLGANVELLIEPSRQKNVEMLIATGIRNPRKCGNLGDFT
jgi:hypothetical protein